jgi:alpha/beta superfamily hydrolase
MVNRRSPIMADKKIYFYLIGLLFLFSNRITAGMIEENVTFKSSSAADCLLEGILYYNSEVMEAPAIIVCHPHPKGGGDMNIPILSELAKRLVSNYTILRFNFRGVGKSQCDFGDGTKGSEDIRGAITFLETHSKIKPKKIFLWGYSYGSGEAFLTTLQDTRVSGSVLVGFPTRYIQGYDNIEGINNKKAPIHIMIGSEDTISAGMKESVTNFVTKNYRNIKLTVIPKADHFFSGFWGGIFDYSSDFFLGIIKDEGNSEKK